MAKLRMFKTARTPNMEMAEVMVSQWRDERLKVATPEEICMSYGVTLEQAHRILTAELKKRRWA